MWKAVLHALQVQALGQWVTLNSLKLAHGIVLAQMIRHVRATWGTRGEIGVRLWLADAIQERVCIKGRELLLILHLLNAVEVWVTLSIRREGRERLLLLSHEHLLHVGLQSRSWH